LKMKVVSLDKHQRKRTKAASGRTDKSLDGESGVEDGKRTVLIRGFCV